jgi:prepilin-type processing-associated H-X9-DG protein
LSKRRVVITGLGIVSPVGNTVDQAWANILAGKSGISRITRFDPTAFSAQIAGEVRGFDVTEYISAKEARRMDLFIHYGLAAGVQAIKDSGIVVTPENAERIGVNFGSGMGGLPWATVSPTDRDFVVTELGSDVGKAPYTEVAGPHKITTLNPKKSISTDIVLSVATLPHKDGGMGGLNALFTDGHVKWQSARGNPQAFDPALWANGFNTDELGFRRVANAWQP